ncbi:hypothetical protein FOZ76_02210 [Verticiella sediminum]|uniref:EthD domain-containing protein n=1 Tax=Verticiella sediminum TaxID=1247510 RepID=A0A556B082_9BURK|nr:DUF4286 family protein [Verticiella sediminum]TSH98587.1 hypothetical protein FOZ76_02210 [Verticiella sediminum]
MSMLQLLIRWPGEHLDTAQAHAWVAAQVGAPSARVLHAVDAPLTYVRVALAEAPAPERVAAWLAAAQDRNPGAELALLRRTLTRPGASAGRPAPWHYVVETDVSADAEADFNAWYDQEHLPGLAGVPGTVHAERHLAAHGVPRYHASYDLQTRETFGSPPWLAVRATAWSDRVRPNFRNTRRIMFRDAG